MEEGRRQRSAHAKPRAGYSPDALLPAARRVIPTAKPAVGRDRERRRRRRAEYRTCAVLGSAAASALTVSPNGRFCRWYHAPGSREQGVRRIPGARLCMGATLAAPLFHRLMLRRPKMNAIAPPRLVPLIRVRPLFAIAIVAFMAVAAPACA